MDEQIKRIPTLSEEELELRFSGHPAKDESVREKHDNVRNLCLDLAEELNFLVPEGREKRLAITKLEEVMMWANAAIARHYSE